MGRPPRRFDAEHVEDGGQHVDVLHGRLDAAAACTGQPHDERRVRHGVEELPAMLHVVAVLEEHLAVVGGEDDQRALAQAATVELGEQGPELRVPVGDLVVVVIDERLEIRRRTRRRPPGGHRQRDRIRIPVLRPG